MRCLWRCLLLLCVLVRLSTPELCQVLRASGVAETEKTGCFVVVLKVDSNASSFRDVQSRLLDLSKDSRLYGSVQKVTKAITVALNDSSLNTARSIPDVEYIEEETMARGQQIPWHLDRLDQLQLPLNQQYLPIAAGKGVDLYILDSGINFAHEEFENRAKYSGYDPMDGYLQENRQGLDCHGHGTHVASLAAGKTFGVAKSLRVYSVRVLDCDNSGPWSVVLQGLDHVSRVVAERGRPAIVSLSLGGGYFRTVNDALQELHSEGIFSASAAGNEFGDACVKSPASSSYTFTVGGTSEGDDIYSFTNYGQCVDMFAPGQSIRGADQRCSHCSRVLSGTSMATPMVSAVAAILLSREPLLTPRALAERLVASAVESAIRFSRIPSIFRSLTRNRLLHISGQCGGVFVTPVVIRSPNYPQSYPHNLVTWPCQWTISTSAPGGVVQCNFTDFDTEAGYDVVMLCDGQFCCPSSLLGSVSGSLPSPPTYSSKTSSLTLQMTSDGIISRRGFSASCYSSASGPTLPPRTVFTLTPPRTISTHAPPTTDPPPVPPSATPPTMEVTFAPPTTEIGITAPPILINDSCNGNELSQQIPLILLDVIEEASSVLQELVSQSLTDLLQSKVLGRLREYPASSCQALASAGLRTSGLYWLRSANSSAVNVFCDLATGYKVSSLGYMRVANLNMTQLSHDCPTSLRAIEGCGRRLCGRGSSAPGCSSVFFSTFGVPYRRVCGSVIGYQFSSPNGFFAHQLNPALSIDDTYLDGVSVTYGAPRVHIWSFAAAVGESAASICPCASGVDKPSIPSFVEQNYFCATGSHSVFKEGKLYCEDALWDGSGCAAENSCCEWQDYNSLFCVDLNESVTEDIELRVCGNEGTLNEDTPLESVSLYVQ